MSDLRSFGFVIKDTSRLYTKRFEERSRSLGFTLAQCKVIVILARNEGISQTRLGELAEIEPMNLVRILDHMELEGWLERRADPADRRARRLFLMPKAATRVEEIWAISDLVRGEAFAGIPRHQAKLLISLLENIRENILSLAPLPETAAAPEGKLDAARGARVPRARGAVKS